MNETCPQLNKCYCEKSEVPNFLSSVLLYCSLILLGMFKKVRLAVSWWILLILVTIKEDICRLHSFGRQSNL